MLTHLPDRTQYPNAGLNVIALGSPRAKLDTLLKHAKCTGAVAVLRHATDLDSLAQAFRRQPADLVVCEITEASSEGLLVPGRLQSECAAGRMNDMPAVLWISDLPEYVLHAYAAQLRETGIALEIARSPESASGALRRFSSWGTLHDALGAAPSPDEAPSTFSDEHLILALGSNEGMRIVLQPQIDLATGQTIGAEALVRWRHPLLGEIAPLSIVSALNRLSLDPLLFYFVTERVLALQARLVGGGVEKRVSVNASVSTLSIPGVVESLEQRTANRGISPELLTVEITEDVAIEDKTALEPALRRLRSRGFGVSMDDFGIGASTLQRLSHLPFSELKIDKSLIQRIHTEATCAAVVDAVIGLGRSLGLSVVAEGVETDAQIRQLHQLGCDVGQGFGLGRPMESQDFIDMMLAQFHRTPVHKGYQYALTA